MAPVFNGQPVDEDVTNPAFLDAQVDDFAVGKIGFQNTDVISGGFIFNIQRAVNSLFDTTGATETTNGTNYPGVPAFTITNGDSHETALTKLAMFLNTNVVPEPIAATSSVGVSTTASSRADHTHEGVHSLGVFGDVTKLTGDVDLEAGTDISLTRVGQRIRIDNTGGGGGGGGGLSTDANGNATLTLRPDLQTFILQSPDTTKWLIAPNNLGVLVATSGASGTVTTLKVTKPDTSEAAFAIANTGIISVVSPPPGGETLNDNFYIASPDGTAWHLGVNNSNVIVMSNTTTAANYFRVISDTGTVLFQTQEINGAAINYFPIFDAVSIPVAVDVPTIAGNLPIAFYDSGANTRLMYFDGTNWRYVFDNSIII